MPELCEHGWSGDASGALTPLLGARAVRAMMHTCRKDAGHQGNHLCSCGALLEQEAA